jgi:predicted membrane protein
VSSEDPRAEPGAVPPPSEVPAQPVHPKPWRRPVPLGRLILGLVLVAIGVLWLLEALDVVSFSFLAILPAGLIIVGILLIGAARTGRHSGLIVLGVILTVVLTFASSFDIRLQGGLGERNEHPTTLADVQREYHLSIGQLTIDLRDLDFAAGIKKVKASVGIGQLTVRVPGGLTVMAKGHAGAGQVMLFGRENSGLDVDLSARSQEQVAAPAGASATTGRLTLDLSVGLGQIEVTR